MNDERSTSDRLKARLTGAIALLVIGVIGWFWLLDADSPVDTVVQESAIPPAPAIHAFEVPEPQPPAGVKPVGSEQGAAPVVEPVEQLSAPSSTGKAAAAAADKVPAARSAPAAEKKPAPAAEKKPAPEKLQLDTNNLPVAWVVQVGAMSTQASADKLKAQLIAKGFKAYTQSVKLASGSTVVKVFVGPKLSRERADAQKRAIDAALNTNAMVVRFPAG